MTWFTIGVSFCCTAKWISYTDAHPLVQTLLPHRPSQCWAGFPVSQQVLLVTCFVYSSLYAEKAMAPTPVLSPGKPHGRRSLVGCSPWGRWESDTTERLHFHFSLSCMGEGNGNPLQRSCLENPRDWGAWWAAVRGVADTTERLSSSSSMCMSIPAFQLMSPTSVFWLPYVCFLCLYFCFVNEFICTIF